MIKHLISPIFVLTALLLSQAEARTWTSKDGVTIDAEYISSDENKVTIKRLKDAKEFTLPLEKLSKQDQEWLKQRPKTDLVADESKNYYLPKEGEILPKRLASLVKKRGRLIFEDSFNREDPDDVEQLGPDWRSNSKRSAEGHKQCDFSDGKLVLKVHEIADSHVVITHKLKEDIKDSVMWIRAKITTADYTFISYSDPESKESQYGRLCGVTMRDGDMKISDLQNGFFSPKGVKLRNSVGANEKLRELIAENEITFSAGIHTNVMSNIFIHNSGRKITVYLEDEELSSYSASGLGHETKRELLISSTGLEIEHLRLWSLD